MWIDLEAMQARFRGNAEPVSMKLDQVRKNLRGREVDSLGTVLDKAYETMDILMDRSQRSLAMGNEVRIRVKQGYENAEDVISMVYEELRERSRRTEKLRG